MESTKMIHPGYLPSKNKTLLWKALRLLRIIVQGIVLLLFVILIGWSPVTEIFFRFNPLTGLGVSIASRSVITYFWPALIILIFTIIFGRFWCGWLCPMGTILDIAGFRKKKRKSPSVSKQQIFWKTLPFITKYDDRLRKVKFILLFIIFIAAIFGNLTVMILDPLTILVRTLTVSILPGLNHIITAIERYLYDNNILVDIVDTVDGLLRPGIIPYEQSFFSLSFLIVIFFICIILLNLIAHRFWCRYLCPLGALLALFSAISLFRRTVGLHCKNCSSCEGVCNMGAIDSKAHYRSKPSECTLCMDCFSLCPETGYTFSPGKRHESRSSISLSRRHFIIGLGAGAVGVGLLYGDATRFYREETLLRPPGVIDGELFLSKCIRCGQCMRVCPTSGLQPSLFEGGIGAVWTPRLIPRLGACDYTCNQCGQVCPTGAIPHLTLEEKQVTPIGKAMISPGRCLEWSSGADCRICREFCPLPVKAVEKRQRIENDDAGNPVVRHGPVIIEERCIGCGICEYLCPVEGEAAIRVVRVSI